MYQDDNGLWDAPQPHSNSRDFWHSFGWAFAGAIAGSMLDNTRFGRWFNTSKVIGFCGQILKVAVLSAIGLYIYCVIKVW